MIAYLRDLLGIQTDMQKAAAGRRWAISELAAGKDPDDLLDQVGSGLTFDGPNPFDNEAREAIIECGELLTLGKSSDLAPTRIWEIGRRWLKDGFDDCTWRQDITGQVVHRARSLIYVFSRNRQLK